MATIIPCEVDTTPMATEIQNVANHVKGTTAAVVAMHSAVIAAENESARKVCNNVNRGFFTMMCSQISQKIANKKARVEALLMQLTQQKRQLLSIKSNMEREYGRISARYFRIFTSIDKEIELRIRQLDQPVFDLVNKHLHTASNRMNALTSWVTTSQVEGIAQSQKFVISKMKRDAQKTLGQSTIFLSQLEDQRQITGKILISSPDRDGQKMVLIPILFSETIDDEGGIKHTEIRTPHELPSQSANLIKNTLMSDSSLQWKIVAVKPKQLNEEFIRLIGAYKGSDKVKSIIKKMYEDNHFESL